MFEICLGISSKLHWASSLTTVQLPISIMERQTLATGDEQYSYVDGIAALVFGSTIENCTMSNSSITSKRTLNNSNCAGGIAGYSTGGTFKNCASKGNTIKTMCYDGK